MPATITHRLFGEDLLPDLRYRLVHGSDVDPALQQTFSCDIQVPDSITFERQVRDAFLLGNQGPDPLFFAMRDPHFVQIKQFGSRIHHVGGQRFMDSLRDFAWCLSGAERSVALAYLCGFVCHYLLDSTVHPLVYSQQFALEKSGVEGLENAGHEIHAQIESDLDAVCLFNLRRMDISQYRTHADALGASRYVLSIVDDMYTFAAQDAYGFALSASVFHRSVEDMRFTMKILHSPDGKRRDALGFVERLFREHSQTQAMSVRSGVGATCSFDNHQHNSWVNPFDGTISNASFFDLLNQVHVTALEKIPLYVTDSLAITISAEASTPVLAAAELFGERNFRGDIEEEH